MPTSPADPSSDRQTALVPTLTEGGGLALVPAETIQRETEAAVAFALADKADATRRADHSDWQRFTAWCTARDVASLLAEPKAVAAYLASESEAGAKPATLARRVAAIRYAHRQDGHEPPTSAEAVRATLRGAVAKAVGNRVQRLRRDDGTASGSEVNHALGGWLTQGLPPIDLAHADLA